MRELASLLNNMFPHSNVDHNDTFPIAATRWQVLNEVRFDLTRAGAEILWQHTHAGAQGRLISVPTLLVIRSTQGGVCAQLLFLFPPARPSGCVPYERV